MSSNSTTSIDHLKVQQNLIEIFTECMMNYRRIWPYFLRFDQGVKNRWKQRKYFSFSPMCNLGYINSNDAFLFKEVQKCKDVVEN